MKYMGAILVVVMMAVMFGGYIQANDTGPYVGAIAVETAARTAGDAALAAAIVAQVDTNVTTAITTYTPRRRGDLLVGGAGVGTNGVWVSKGATTNDWVAVAP
jgi:hypothetical protein